MKLHEFLESLYVQTNIDNQVEYHPYKASKINAIQSLLNCQKDCLKVLAYFKIIYHYALMKLGKAETLLSSQEIVKKYQEKKEQQALEQTSEYKCEQSE